MEDNYSIFYSEISPQLQWNKTINIDSFFDGFVATSSPQLDLKEKATSQSKSFSVAVQQPLVIETTKKKVKKYSKLANENKFIHKITMNYLQELKQCRLLSAEEMEAVQRYQMGGNSLRNHKQLMNASKELRRRCYQFYTSTEFLKKIMQSKITFSRKIFFLQKVQNIKSQI